jgi:hypothetical protein
VPALGEQLWEELAGRGPHRLNGYAYLCGSSITYPLLRDAAEKNARISSYPAYAAELGGEKMLPVFVALEKSPDTKFTHLNAVIAMGSTGSRAAIPLLHEQLGRVHTIARIFC